MANRFRASHKTLANKLNCENGLSVFDGRAGRNSDATRQATGECKGGKQMHNVFRFDDQSLRKNEWNCMLVAKQVRLFFGVFREEGRMPWSQVTQLRFDCVEEKKWSRFRAYQLLKYTWHDGNSLGIQDVEFWQQSVPGLVGVNTELFPLNPEERLLFFRRLGRECDNARSELLFCDLGTGLATPKLMAKHTNPRSPMHLYWDELRALFDGSRASLAVYQHTRRQSWASIVKDYRAALEDRSYDLVQLKSGRARIIVVLKPNHLDRILHACREIVKDFRHLKVFDHEGGLIRLVPSQEAAYSSRP